MTLSSVLLSTAELSPEREVQEISVAMLPLQNVDHLVNLADNFGVGWLDQKNGQLRLQFQLVVLFRNAKTDGLWLSIPEADERIALRLTCVASPGVGQTYTQLSWSSQSRFVVDEVVELPDWATSAARFELFAGAAGNPEKIGDIHVREAPKSDATQSSVPMIITPTPTMAATAAIDKNIPVLVRRMVECVRGVNRLLLYTVVLPTLLATIYFGLIASDVYVSESKFIVRSPDQQTTSPLGVIFKGAGVGSSQDDSYTVQEFILSRDALRKLDERMAIGKSFGSKNVDIVSRFAGLDWDNSFEGLFKYYQKKVDVQLDSASSIATLTTRGFTPDDSLRANQLLLEMSEALVNQLNENGRQDMIKFAAREVAEAEKRDKEATLALARVQTGSAKLATGANSLVSKFTEYQRLALEKEYADKILATAVSSLEEARNQALRKQLYIERIAQPSKPDMAMEPKRLRSVLAVFIFGLVVWGVLVMLIAGVKEHQD